MACFPSDVAPGNFVAGTFCDAWRPHLSRMATSLLLGSRQRRKKHTAGNERTAVLLLPIELDLVNRDDLTKTWTANEQKQAGLVTVYAGTTTGDEVAWKLNAPTSWLGGTFTWTATDSQGNVINGPTGVGIDHWQISDTGGNDPASNTSLTWKPDTYTIKCNIVSSGGGTIPIQFTQKVGWRTEDYVVIGQIVNNITFQNSGPANLTDSTLFDGAIITDCAGTFTLGAGLTEVFHLWHLLRCPIQLTVSLNLAVGACGPTPLLRRVRCGTREQ